MKASNRNWSGLGCAALIGAAVAFPAGMMFAGRSPPPREAARAPNTGLGAKATARNVYSPGVLSDPYVLDQQLRVVEALELSCSQFGDHCTEARQARRRIDEARADR